MGFIYLFETRFVPIVLSVVTHGNYPNCPDFLLLQLAPLLLTQPGGLPRLTSALLSFVKSLGKHSGDRYLLC